MRRLFLQCFFSKPFLFSIVFLSSIATTHAQVSGKVFRDFNANGIQTTAAPDPIEPGLQNVTVNAYDNTGTLFSATTSATGTYSIAGGTGPYRVEFILPAFYYASNGSTSNTTVQFVAAGGTANLGVNSPEDYCNTVNPTVLVPIFINGATTNATVQTQNTITKFAYSANSSTTGSLSTYSAKSSATGTVYGMAYDRNNKVVYSGAFLKRHTGLLNGLGTIYATDPVANTTSVFTTVTNVGTIPNDATRGLTSTTATSRDVAAFSLIGKAGLGDVDISADNKTLYTINLNSRELVTIDIATKVQSTFTIPTTGCTNGEVRPFGLGIRNNIVYVGTVCSGETTGTTANLSATVYAFNGTTFTSVLTFPLTYTRGVANNGAPCDAVTTWLPWTNSESTFFTSYAQSDFTFVYPQPILSDIDFDNNGDMILGIMDRAGHQAGSQNLPPTINSNLYAINTGGDMLRAYLNNTGTWTIENNGDKDGTGSYVASAIQKNTEGPGGGEFYFGDSYLPTHHETSQGALAFLKGSTKVLTNGYDAYQIYEGSIYGLSNNDGSKVSGYSMYVTPYGANPTFSKANGLGDLELLCNAQPIEIGNRVFTDTDRDGIQDPNEAGIASVRVELWKAGAFDSFTTTNANGQYLFSNVLANTAYEIKILAANIPSGKVLTTKDAISAGAADVADSDASLVGSDAVIAYTTGNAGENDHTLDFGFKLPVCGITLKPTVSGCYQNGGSKATVSVEVAWSDALSGPITVTFAGQTRTITPGLITVNYGYQVGNQSQTIVSPQVVAFEIPATGTAGQAIEAFFGASYAASTCKATQSVAAPAACPSLTCTAGTDMGGTVFNDYDTDGVKDSGETTGLVGVTVTAIACDGTTYTTTTDVLGKYKLAVPPAKYPVRVEFSGIPTLYGQGTNNGTDGRTTTQFVAAADCSVDLGVVDPNDYCQNNPNIYIPIFGNGDPRISGSTAATAAGIVTFPYDYAGSPNTAGYPSNTKVTNAYNVGSQWGNAYNKKTKRMFTSAFLRRHAGLGDKGLGEIYITDLTNPAAPTTSEFINVNTNLGVVIEDPSNPVLSNAVRGLVGDKTAPSNDPSTISQIGRVGMGDLDISDDGNTLWFTNLYDRKLYSIDITAFNADGVTKPTTAVAHTFPDPNCSGGVARPFGLKIYKGETYVGVVCDASTSQNKSDLRAFVYKLNGATWTTAFDFPLTYPKGFGHNSTNLVTRTGWYPWTDDWNTMTNPYRVTGGSFQWAYPTPLLSDIEFDIDGSMVLGFLDRSAIVAGSNNYGPTGTQSYSGLACGDILKAYYSNGTYILENAAKAGPFTGASPTNNQGPGFGEFYDDNFIFTFNGGAEALDHAEIAFGALALRPGSNEVVATAFDPRGFDTPAGFWPNPFDVGGVIHSNNTTGAKNSGYGIYQGGLSDGLFGKSVGLGDIELACATPTYLQIGNYVWLDTDKDGVQDACETPMNGVKVSLYKDVAGVLTKIASTTTGANGEYYFSDNTAAGVTWTGTGIDVSLLPTQAYKVVFGETQYSTGKLTLSGTNYVLTQKDAITNTGNDQNDSDATEMSISGTMYPSISATTGAIGSVNHTLDVGFSSCPTISTPSTTQTICVGTSGADITVNTDQNAANSIKFVKFSTDQSPTNGSETATELNNIYAGTAIGTSVTPTGASSPYTATYTWNSTDFPNVGTTPLTYYVYAILASGGSCQPVQEIKVVVNPLPTFAVESTNVNCYGAADGTLTIKSVTGTSPFQYSKDDGATFDVAIPATTKLYNNLTPAPYKPAVKDANGCVKKCN